MTDPIPSENKGFSSSPCSLHEFEDTDPDQWRDVNRWRKAERIRLLDLRKRANTTDREDLNAKLMIGLRDLLHARQNPIEGKVLSMYWPIKGEPDLRPLMTELHHAGVTIALPIVEQKAAPLVFRRWTPETKMVRGDWNILVPPSDADALVPQIALAPLVGWDGDCFRLGYGGGYFDRTLAALDPRPFTIGIGVQAARLHTIFPQSHDIPTDVILAEAGVQATLR